MDYGRIFGKFEPDPSNNKQSKEYRDHRATSLRCIFRKCIQNERDDRPTNESEHGATRTREKERERIDQHNAQEEDPPGREGTPNEHQRENGIQSKEDPDRLRGQLPLR